MCVLECIYISVYLEQYKKLKGNSKHIISKLEKLYTELFDKKIPEKFDDLDIIKTLEHAAGKYNIKFIIYNNDENDRLNHLNTIGTGEKIHNLLMITGLNEEKNQVVHVMYIKDI
jgi:transcription antitermination factor NusA-like protein